MYAGFNGLTMSRIKGNHGHTFKNQFWIKPNLCGPCRKVVINAVRGCFRGVQGDNWIEQCVSNQLKEAENEELIEEADAND